MLNILKEYHFDVAKGYRNNLMNEELAWVLQAAITEIEKAHKIAQDLELELLYLKRDVGWTNQ